MQNNAFKMSEREEMGEVFFNFRKVKGALLTEKF
jgi:hypothetical protein